MNWDFIVLFGTMLFWALLHMWSPDGRQWRHDKPAPERPADAPPDFDHDTASAPRG